MTTFAAFRCGLNKETVQIHCSIRPIFPSAFSSVYYNSACYALDDILQLARNYCVDDQEGWFFVLLGVSSMCDTRIYCIYIFKYICGIYFTKS